MRLADLEKSVKEMEKLMLEMAENLLDIYKRIEVLEHAHETSIDIDNGEPNSGSEPPENGLNPSEPG